MNKHDVKGWGAKSFGELLSVLRQAAGFSTRCLGVKAGVPYSAISMFEQGKYPCGPTVAKKLANGLGLHGKARKLFETKASTTTRRARATAWEAAVLKRCQSWHKDSEITRVELPSGQGHAGYDVIVTLKGGKQYGVEFKVTPLTMVVVDEYHHVAGTRADRATSPRAREVKVNNGFCTAG